MPHTSPVAPSVPPEPTRDVRTRIRLGDVEIDVRGQRILRGDRVQRLTTREAQLIAYLAARAGRLVSRDELLTRVWGFHHLSRSRAVDKAVNRLRAKIEDDSANPVWLQTVHGEGYVLHLSDDDASRFPRVPRPVQGLHGRTEALAALDAWWNDGGVLAAVVGVAGIGKSLLVRHFAWRLSRGGVPVVVADLAGVSDVAGARRAIARAAGFAEAAGARAVDLARHLDGQAGAPTLLVLDHTDDLDGDIGELTDPLLGLAPGLSVLLVGRERPRSPRLRLVNLGPLELEAAEALVREVAQARVAGGPGRWHPRLVRDLVRRLEGNPAALQVAAALSREHGPGEVLAMLGGADRVLPFHPVPARALEKAIGVSCRALDPQGRRDLAALARLADGFTRDEALAVLEGDERRARRALADLVDRSLVVAEVDLAGRRRYRLGPFVRALVRERSVTVPAPGRLHRDLRGAVTGLL